MRMEKYEELFDSDPAKGLRERLMAGVILQRVRTIKAGKMLYADSYPVWDLATTKTADEILEKRQKSLGTSEKQAAINGRHAQRKMEMLINANFGEGNLLLTLTYRNEEQPKDWKQARKDVRNYIRRVRYWRKRRGLPEMKYVCVMEETWSEKNGRRFHHHVTISGDGMTRDEAEQIWNKNFRGFANSKVARMQKEGLTGWARYITKEIAGNGKGQTIPTGKRWYASQNLQKPWQKATTSDRKISRSRAVKIAEEVNAAPVLARAVYEKLYPGYELIDVKVRVSAFIGGAYIYTVMVKRE